MLAFHLHPALSWSALPHFEQTGLLNKHKLTVTTNTSKAQLAKAGSGCGFAAVSLLHVRKRERKENAAGMCPEERYLNPPGAAVRASSSRQKVSVLLLCQPPPAGCAIPGKGHAGSSSSCWGGPMPSYYMLIWDHGRPLQVFAPLEEGCWLFSPQPWPSSFHLSHQTFQLKRIMIPILGHRYRTRVHCPWFQLECPSKQKVTWTLDFCGGWEIFICFN